MCQTYANIFMTWELKLPWVKGGGVIKKGNSANTNSHIFLNGMCKLSEEGDVFKC